MRRAGMIAAGCSGLAAVAAAGISLALRDTPEPVGVEDAVTSFHGETTAAPGRSPIPEGVYVYGQASERAVLQGLADRWTVTLRRHAEHLAAVYPMTWREAS